ncbi:hypothetical protein GCM10010177_03420 [Actinomadura citrea]|nr:hypothetical protein GCM10010177_03420 [Actinomadura citrea]
MEDPPSMSPVSQLPSGTTLYPPLPLAGALRSTHLAVVEPEPQATRVNDRALTIPTFTARELSRRVGS